VQVLWNTDLDRDSLLGRFQIAPVGGLPLSLATWHYSERLLQFRAEGMEPTTEYMVVLQRGIRSVLGQSFDSNYFFSFVTGTLGTVTAPQLVAPTHQSRIEHQPIFEWQPVSGAKLYEIELSPNSHFHPLEWQTQVAASLTTVQPDEPLAGARSYFWRVRAQQLDSQPGPWSDVWTFYLEDTGLPDPYQLSLYELPQGFWLSEVEPWDGTRAAYLSLLTVTFNQALDPDQVRPDGTLPDELFQVWELDLFGDPARPEQVWSGTTYVAGNALVFSPATTVLGYNSIYEWRASPFLRASSGQILGQAQSGLVVGPITPILATPRQLRMEYGPLYLTDVPDSYLWEAIGRAGLVAKLLQQPNGLVAHYTISDLRSLGFVPTLELVDYVKLRAAYQVGRWRLAEFAVQVGRNLRLGDFSYQIDLDAYTALENYLKRLEDELAEIESTIFGWAGAHWVVIGHMFDPDRYHDTLYEPRDHLGPSVWDNTGSNYHSIWSWPFESDLSGRGTDTCPEGWEDVWFIVADN